MYVSTDDIRKLVDNALEATHVHPISNETIEIDYGILRGYLYAIQDILTKEEN